MNKRTNEAALLREWTERLGLTDWKIRLQLDMNQEELAAKDADGCTIFEESVKGAIIQIAKEDNDPMRLREYNFEETLVHELLHLKMCFLQTDNENNLQDRIVHQIIDDFARLLVEMKYKTN